MILSVFCPNILMTLTLLFFETGRVRVLTSLLPLELRGNSSGRLLKTPPEIFPKAGTQGLRRLGGHGFLRL
jgi:hypothetical protein